MPESTRPDDLAAVMMAVALMMEDEREQTAFTVKVREVWPQPSEWRWVGW
ncbi:MAG: hypothetical protein OWR62_05570 [Sulfobacillus thermotolerans]|nr:hypothetical protein [Sulfobacillus thermotolerans]